MPSELEAIRRLGQRCPAIPPVTTGIGDDAAVLQTANLDEIVVATDMLLDGVHFDSRSASVQLIGRKALAVNLSDLAAMNAWPTAAFLSVALPRASRRDDRDADPLAELVAGMQPFFDAFEFGLAGGDTNVWDGPLVLNIGVTGRPNAAGQLVYRRGASEGDRVFVTGPLGGSLEDGRHLTFEPRLRLARELCRTVEVSAMLDLSDGLAIDLYRLCEASGCGAVLEQDAIPRHSTLRAKSTDEQIHRALSDGEDFELLFTVAEKQLTPETVQELNSLGAIPVGRITRDTKLRLRTATAEVIPLEPAGWQHNI